MKRPRAGDVLRPVHDMVELVRIFAGHVAERDLGEAGGGLGGEGVHWQGPSLRAKRSNPALRPSHSPRLDCRVASLLAMTEWLPDDYRYAKK
jgi:hypothetical protein